ncbi:hypothetical protein CAPTEDRAFT_185065, partial [Capitella teleta]
LPPMIAGCCVYSTITYWVIGFFPDAYTFILFTLGVNALMCAIIAIGHMCSAIFPDAQTCLTVCPIFLGTFILFAGYLVQEETILPVFYPLMYMSPYRYAYAALTILQWRDVPFISCTDVRSGNDTDISGCLHNGNQVLEEAGYDPDSLSYLFCFVVGFFFLFEAIGCLAMWRRVSKRKK